jgi:hypothetical protein
MMTLNKIHYNLAIYGFYNDTISIKVSMINVPDKTHIDDKSREMNSYHSSC